MGQGDFSSKDFASYYSRHIHLDTIYQLGYDGYKRHNMKSIITANIWSARRMLFTQNFIFPLFFTDYDIWFALLYGEIKQDSYKELVYEILKRSNPELLNIPFAGESLPQLEIEPYMRKTDSIHHWKEPFLWDYQYVRKNLKPLLIKNDLGKKGRLLQKLLMLNELDYFLNKQLSAKIELYRKNKISLIQCVKDLIYEKRKSKYPKSKKLITMTQESMKDPYIPHMQILMDFASAANKKSFNQMENEMELSGKWEDYYKSQLSR